MGHRGCQIRNNGLCLGSSCVTQNSMSNVHEGPKFYIILFFRRTLFRCPLTHRSLIEIFILRIHCILLQGLEHMRFARSQNLIHLLLLDKRSFGNLPRLFRRDIDRRKLFRCKLIGPLQCHVLGIDKRFRSDGPCRDTHSNASKRFLNAVLDEVLEKFRSNLLALGFLLQCRMNIISQLGLRPLVTDDGSEVHLFRLDAKKTTVNTNFQLKRNPYGNQTKPSEFYGKMPIRRNSCKKFRSVRVSA